MHRFNTLYYDLQNEVNAAESELLQYHVEESERVQKMSEYIAELQSEVQYCFTY